MAVIVTRAGKGSPLTNNEVDANFINLNTELGLKALAGANSDITSLSGITGGISTADYLDIDTAATPAGAVGRLSWDDGNGTASLGLKGGNVTLQLGQETLARVYNDSGTALTDGQLVYISGAQGNRIAVKLANAGSEATSAGTLGMVTEPIASGAEGFITIMGTVNGLNTSGLTAGALLYLDTTAGGYSMTAPTPPNHRVIIGYVERVHATVGSIYVKVDNGYELEELHNVLITTPANDQVLQYESATSLWKNKTLVTLPSQTGNSGKYLTTNGTTASWATINLSAYLPLSGGTMTGAITFAAGQTWPTFNQNTTGSSGSCTGNAATVTNGIYTTTYGNYSTFNQVVIASQAGFQSATYSSGRNRIWSFANADGYGISYFQGAGGYGGSDSIGMHFGTATAAASQFTFASAGNFIATANVTAYSDERLKTNWREYTPDFVRQLAKLKHGTYDRTDKELTQDGVGAQGLQEILPNSVLVGEDGYLSVNYGGAAMVSAVQLAKRVVEQDERLVALEAVVAKLVD